LNEVTNNVYLFLNALDQVSLKNRTLGCSINNIQPQIRETTTNAGELWVSKEKQFDDIDNETCGLNKKIEFYQTDDKDLAKEKSLLTGCRENHNIQENQQQNLSFELKKGLKTIEKSYSEIKNLIWRFLENMCVKCSENFETSSLIKINKREKERVQRFKTFSKDSNESVADKDISKYFNENVANKGKSKTTNLSILDEILSKKPKRIRKAESKESESSYEMKLVLENESTSRMKLISKNDDLEQNSEQFCYEKEIDNGLLKVIETEGPKIKEFKEENSEIIKISESKKS
jgi:hypothetical protein